MVNWKDYNNIWLGDSEVGQAEAKKALSELIERCKIVRISSKDDFAPNPIEPHTKFTGKRYVFLEVLEPC